MIEYLEFHAAKHRATREALIKEGKTYRSRDVAFQNGCLSVLADIQFDLELPRRNAELREAVAKFGEMLKR